MGGEQWDAAVVDCALAAEVEVEGWQLMQRGFLFELANLFTWCAMTIYPILSPHNLRRR